MDRVDKRRRRTRNHKGKKPPKVPIKTYRWEDIRRWRRRGGYPWTHLYKGPYLEKVNPDQFTMDAFRRAKSSDRMDVSEVSSWADYSGKTTPTLLHELTSDTPSKKTSRRESPIVDDDLEDDVQIKEFQPESGESSSENVSQYLDKEEVPPKPLGLKPEETTLTSEPADRKRKLSTESGHSFLKRIQAAKRKIKVPKISFSTKKFNKKLSSPSKDSTPKKIKKQIEKTPLHKTDDKPHYIYIPLKPPPGQTDEFSYLEFASNENGLSKEEQGDKSRKSSEVCEENLSDIKNVGSVQGSSETHDEKEARLKLAKEEPTKSEKSNAQQDTFTYTEKGASDIELTATKGSQEDIKKSPVKVNPAFRQFLKKVRHLKNSDKTETILKDNVAEERINTIEKADTSGIPKVSTTEENMPSKRLNSSSREQNESQLSNQAEIVETSNSGLDLDNKIHVGQILTDDEEGNEVVKASDDTNTVPEDADAPKISEDDQFDRLFETSSKKDPKHWELTVPAGSSGNVEEVTRKTRSKSAEPEKKRKLSLESRKSLSRLGLMKKLREVSGKVTNALSVENFKQLFKSNESHKNNTNPKTDDGSVKKEHKVKVDEKHKRTRPTPVEPVYIRIPLKPPEGKTDEFSYLEDSADVSTVSKEAKREERADSLDTTSPNEIKSKDIQFIFLTPPSDDELLDKDSDIPETPSLDEVVGFGPLKKLAQDVVDQVSPDTKKNVLESVGDVSDNHSEAPDRPQHNIDTDHPSTEENMVVDVEDGLNEAAKTDDSRKSALKSNEPTYQKRVSFKRKCRASKEPAKENEYELIQAPSEETAANTDKTDQNENTGQSLQVCETMQLMSVNGENTNLHLDIVEDVHLEEEFKRCSKITGDHEYEPISAPDELTVLPSVVDDDDPKLVISAAEILDRPTEDKKRSFFQFGRFRKDTTQATNDRNLGIESSSDIPERESQDLKKSTFLMQLNRFRKGPVQDDTLAQVNQPEVHRFRPHIKKPKFGKIDFKRFKPNINLHLPQLPDTATIRFPHISLPGAKKTTETRTVESRQFSTESNADDAEHEPKRHRFDLNFRATFPRLAKKKKSSSNAETIFATTPRVKKNNKKKLDDNIRIPLHSEDSIGTAETRDLEEETDRQIGHTRYEENIEMSVADDKLLNRWKHGSFRERPQAVDSEERIIGQLVEQRFGVIGQGYRSESLDDRLRQIEEKSKYTEDDLDDDKEEEFVLESRLNDQLVTDLDNLDDEQLGGSKEGYSSEGSGSLGQKGRLGKLDIDSDEFFVVHEIREGFQTPANALAQMNEYDPIGSSQCLQQMSGLVEQKERRKAPIKKPKRKKTPHVSREEIQGDEESIDEMALPSRPKRRSEKASNKTEEGKVVPYQETISLHGHRLDFPRESLGILGDDEEEIDDINREPLQQVQRNHSMNNRRPRVPTRKHKSLKSLDQSETESLLDTDSGILQEQQIQGAPRRPSRRSNSMLNDTEDLTKTHQENGNRECVEEPCIQDIRDYMGYSIVDKSKQREPPLPPPRTLPRRSKRDLASEHRFATLPGTQLQRPPVRPLRNYSTVSHVKSSPMYCPHGNKENEIDIGQYIETNSEEATRNLVSGEIVQKMQSRPLPAPPRPPRKSKTNRRSLQDITSQANICEETVSTQTEPLPPDFICEEISEEPTDKVIFPRIFESTPVSNAHSQQYHISDKKPETLEPGKYLQEEKQHTAGLHSQVQEILDSGANNTESKKAQNVESYNDSQLQKFHIYDPRSNQPQTIRRELITPSIYTFEETVTHGTLLVQPLNETNVLSDHQLPKERVVPITQRDSMDDFEPSEVPETFELPKSAKDQDLAVTEAQPLQVTDLDVDPLISNQSLTHDISVPNNQMQRNSSYTNLEDPHKIPGGPDITSANLEYQKSQSQKGQLQAGDDYMSHIPQSSSIAASNPLSSSGQGLLNYPDAIPQCSETSRVVDDPSFHSTGIFLVQEQQQSPVPPPRSSTLERGIRGTSLQRTYQQLSTGIDPSEDVEESSQLVMLEPEIDDQAPPPRPPHPRYVPSQPPAAFYALRAQKYVDEHMPVTAPLRKRQQRCRPVSRSRSTSEDEVSSTNPRRSSKISRRSSEASIPELSRRLIEACGSRINNTLKRLIFDLTQKFLRNSDGNQDLHVFMVILLVLIAGLILLGYGEERTVVHLHHWEYFNPPKDL